MTFADFLMALLVALNGSGIVGQFIISGILIAIGIFVINLVCIPHRINKIKNDVESIKNMIAQSVECKDVGEKEKTHD